MEIPLNLDDIKITSQEVLDFVRRHLYDNNVPWWLATIIAGIPATIVLVFTVIIAVVVQGVTGLGSWVAVQVLTLISQVRRDNASDFNAVIGAALSEFLGVEISGDDLPAGSGPAGIDARVRAIGDKVHSLLMSEFQLSGPIEPATGADNARKFTGYGINFAVASAFVSILSETCTIGFLKEFRELGVETAQALGLGRLQRLALQPLIRNAIQQPYDLYLKGILRPDRLSEAQIVQALKSGQLDEAAARQMLAEKGYPDNLIDILVNVLAQKIAATELEIAVRYNYITEEQAIQKLTEQGIDEADAKLSLQVAAAKQADAQLSGILADLENQLLEGFIDQGQFSSFVSDLPLTPEAERLYRKKVANKLENPRKRITFGELKTGITNGIVDFDFADSWLEAQGYSAQEHQILVYELIQALADAEAKAAAKNKTKAKAAAKRVPVPPTSPLNK